MTDVRCQAHEVRSVRTRQPVLEVLEQVVPRKAAGGLAEVRNAAANAAVCAPALKSELVPEAAFRKVKELLLL